MTLYNLRSFESCEIARKCFYTMGKLVADIKILKFNTLSDIIIVHLVKSPPFLFL